MKNRAMVLKSVYAAAVLVACFALTTCQSLKAKVQEPQVSLKTVDVANISFNGIDLLCKVNVDNPNAFTIPFPELGWRLLINDNHFIDGTIKNGNPLRARGTTEVEIPVSLNYTEVFNTFKSLIGSTEVDYKIPLDIKFNLPVLGEKVFHLEPAGTIPLLQFPSFSFKGISAKTMLLPPRLDFELSWEVENKNGFVMLVNDISYNLSVNNSQWAAGSTPKGLRINPKQKQVLSFSGSISGLALVSSIADILQRGSDLTYLCEGNFDLGLDFPGFKNFALPYNYSGSTKLLK
jgi:LEA14-like dessication related protein